MDWAGLLEKAIWLAQIASALIEAAHDLAVSVGVDPDEFDRKVRDLEAQRAASIGSVLDRLKAMLGKA